MPVDLARAVDPTTVQTPALALIDRELAAVERGETDRLIISLPPQEGKSTRVTTVGALWFLLRNPDRRVAVVSYGQELADEFGRNIRNFLAVNDGEDGGLDLGLRIARDNGSIRKWQVQGRRGGVRSVGLLGGLTGRAVDALFIDDPISNMEQALSQTYRDRAWRFWQGVAGTRLAPGAPVVLILTRWHHDDLAGRLLAAEDGDRWRVVNIPAQARHDPAKGETDPLGREPGEWLRSAREYRDPVTGLMRPRSDAEWEAIRRQVGPTVFQALYQGDPSPEDGDVFPSEWARYTEPLWVEQHDGSRWVLDEDQTVEVVQSWDMAFKDTKASDYVVGQVWARIGNKAYLLDQVRGRWGFTETCRQLVALSRKWPQATAKFVEDKANGPAVMNALQRTIIGMIPVEPEGSKMARAQAVSPLAHSGNIVLPTSDPDSPMRAEVTFVDDLTLEASQFPNGTHDDQVDTMSQAVNRLLLMPTLDGEVLGQEDLLDLGEDPTGYAGGYE
jgi:predicted phage terminase large subunit-like protein